MTQKIRLLILVACFSTTLFKAQSQTEDTLSKPPIVLYHETEELPSNTFLVPDKPFRYTNLNEIRDSITYPKLAIDMNLEETIIFKILIDEKGNYIRHLPPKRGHPLLVQAVEPYLSLVHFEPATKDGKPTKFWISIPFVFKIPETKPKK